MRDMLKVAGVQAAIKNGYNTKFGIALNNRIPLKIELINLLVVKPDNLLVEMNDDVNQGLDLSNLLNIGRPGTLALCFSINSAEISIFSRLAYSRNSVSCASILNTCLSSTSVDLRAYKKNFCIYF